MSSIVSLALVIIGLISALVAGWVVIRSTWIRGELDAAKNRIDGLRGDVGDRDKRITEKDSRIERLEMELRASEESKRVLEGVVTAREELQKMNNRLDEIKGILVGDSAT